MNKIRLIRIFELRGKIHPMEQYVIGFLDGIEQYNKGYYIEYMKDGKKYCYYNLNTNDIIIDSVFYEEYETNFGCSYEETKEIMKYLLEKHLNITNIRII